MTRVQRASTNSRPAAGVLSTTNAAKGADPGVGRQAPESNRAWSCGWQGAKEVLVEFGSERQALGIFVRHGRARIGGSAGAADAAVAVRVRALRPTERRRFVQVKQRKSRVLPEGFLKAARQASSVDGSPAESGPASASIEVSLYRRALEASAAGVAFARRMASTARNCASVSQYSAGSRAPSWSQDQGPQTACLGRQGLKRVTGVSRIAGAEVQLGSRAGCRLRKRCVARSDPGPKRVGGQQLGAQARLPFMGNSKSGNASANCPFAVASPPASK